MLTSRSSSCLMVWRRFCCMGVPCSAAAILRRFFSRTGDPRGEQLMAFRIAERAHGASQTPAVSEVMFHGGLFLLVRVPPVPFSAGGLYSGAFLLETFPVPHRQNPPAGIAELVYYVRGTALVFEYRSTALSRCSLLYFAIKGFSSRSGSPRKRHHLGTLKIHRSMTELQRRGLTEEPKDQGLRPAVKIYDVLHIRHRSWGKRLE